MVEECSWFEESQEGLLEGSEELGGLTEGLEGSGLEGSWEGGAPLQELPGGGGRRKGSAHLEDWKEGWKDWCEGCEGWSEG